MVYDGAGGGVELEGMQATEAKDNGICIKGDSEHCSMCLTLDQKFKKAEERCSVLEVEIEKNRSNIELLRSELTLSLVQNYVLESLVESSKELDDRISRAVAEEGKGEKDLIDLPEDVEEDKVLELMIENKVLNCEKKKAENEIEFWKAKCRELEVQVASLDLKLSSTSRKRLLIGTTNAGLVSARRVKKDMILSDVLQDDCCGVATPMLDTFCGNVRHVTGASEFLYAKGQGCVSQAKRQLNFVEGNPDKMAPLTPAAGQPAAAGLVDVSDSDEEASDLNPHDLHESRNRTLGPDNSGCGVASYRKVVSSSDGNKVGVIDQSEIEDDMTRCYRSTPSLRASKRKRASHVVHSESSSESDDNVPLCRLRKRYATEAIPLQENYSKAAGCSLNREVESVTNERFVVSPKSYGGRLAKQHSHSNLRRSECENNRSIPTNVSFTDDETEDDESDSEDESLKNFIVSGSESDFSVADESSEGDEISNDTGKFSSEPKDESEPNMDYSEIIDKIGRRKDHLTKWVFEADMLAALGKDPELCMKAVCALYRKQTADEKMSKYTIHQNQRGFSQCDALRGSILGEFLTGGDPEGGLKKTLEELREFDPKGVELCTTLATHYSKQLFAMYENNEDPLWPDL